MREHLVREAWPSLSTESRLQIIEAMNTQPIGGYPAPIVRSWVSRLSYIKMPARDGAGGTFGFLYASTDEELRLYRQAKGDSCELVRVCAERGETLWYRTLADEPQFRRLAFLRSMSSPEIADFFEWLDRAIDATVPDVELTDCAKEFLGLPEVRRKLERNPDDFPDGGDAYTAGKAMP
jgi:hypothetical protein